MAFNKLRQRPNLKILQLLFLMHIQRLHIPQFRVLKSVDIQFEHDFFPRIFPLGSQNGGGKSTLLQLMFTLLHCCVEEERLPFLQNILEGYQVEEESGQQLLAEIEVWDEEESQSVMIRFFCCDKRFLKGASELRVFPSPSQKYLSEYVSLHEEIEEEEQAQAYLLAMEESEKELKKMERKLNKKKQKLIELEKYLENFRPPSRSLSDYAISKKIFPITPFGHDNNFLLCCTIDRFNSEQVKSFLKKLSAKVFLAAPMTQVFLFLSKEQRRTLFNKYLSYNLAIEDAKKKLPHFFGYDFLAVNTVIDFFKRARDLDFKQAIEKGIYGAHYFEFMNHINVLLANKKIFLNPDLSGVSFKLDEEGIELEPEDLSHGELKRLSIYAWLKGQDIKNAIVLMDEIEIAFHPDWQYQIIRDLQDWAPENQYILATHSFDVCEALTPAHVKELEPKLQKRDAL